MSAPYERIAEAAEAGTNNARAAAGAPTGHELNIYLDPLNPSADLTLKDRVQLVAQSARPWQEFFDFRMYNIPPFSELKLRLQSNVETFFYNYFIIALLFMAVFALGHPFAVLALLIALGVAFFLYVLKPEPLNIAGIEIGSKAKHVVVALVSIVALTVCNVLTLIFSLAIFLLLVVGTHSAIREHAA